MPRSVSWPESRTGMPSSSREAKASASAWPQSMPPSDDRLAPPLELLRELRVDREAVRDGEQLLVQLAEPLGGDRRDDRVSRRRAPATGSAAGRVRRRRGRSAFELLVRDRAALW